MRIRGYTWPAIGTFTAVLAAASAGLPPWSVALAAMASALAAALFVQRAAQRDAEARAQLRVQLQRRDDQLAYTAHELRTPLTSVVTALEMLREGFAATPTETAEFLDQAATAAQHLTFLVNDVLDEAALRTGQLRLSREVRGVDVLLAAAGRIMLLQARARGVALRIDAVAPELRVHTDERRFLQIVFNLVGNALKFTPAGGTVCLRAEASENHVRFRVVDDGPGVPQAARERLFQPFACAAIAPGSSIQGTGLGLFVCRRLVEQLGGTIGYEPGQERGSVFWFDQVRTIAAVAGATR